MAVQPLVLQEDLILGADEDPPLGTVSDVVVDSRGNIYVLDTGFETIRKYTPEGIYERDLGGIGEGPGMYYAPTCLAVGPEDRVYVGGRSSIVTILTSDGAPAGQFRRHASNSLGSIAIDAGGRVYTTCLDPASQQIVHVYEATTHALLRSFSHSYASGMNVHPAVERVYAGGYIDIGPDSLLYYVQRAPQEVRVFDRNGRLLATHATRRGEVGYPPEPEYTERGTTFRMGPMATAGIALSGGRFLTAVIFPGEKRDGRKILVDVYDRTGELSFTLEAESPFYVRSRDKQGRVFVSENRNEVPVLVRYRMLLDD